MQLFYIQLVYTNNMPKKNYQITINTSLIGTYDFKLHSQHWRALSSQ